MINFLRKVAQQVAAFLGRRQTQGNATPKEYLQFLMEVLQAISDSKGNPAVVYPLFRQNLDKLDLNLAQILTAWARDTFSQVKVEEAAYIAAVIGNFANLIAQFPLGRRADNLEIAIAAYQLALAVYTREAYPEKWAATQNNLGNAYSDRIKGERADNLEKAIAAYELALAVYTREAYPEDWAMTQNNLAAAYSDRIKGERADNLEQAIAAYQLALAVYTREAYPEDWAMTQNNLAAAYSDRIKGERADNLEQAIAAYQLALEVRTREAYPEDWAMTQNNLGIAYSDRIKGERADNLEQAIRLYREALEIRTREAFPQDYVVILFNLGLAYRDAAQLENAFETFAAAIDTVEEIRSNIILGGEAARQKLAAEWSKLYRNMVEVCLELENYAVALEYVERGKARNLVELMAATRLKPAGVIPEVWERYDNLYQQWWHLQQQQNGGNSTFNQGSGSNNSRNGNDSRVSTDISPADISQNFTSQNFISQKLTELRQQIDQLIAAEITPYDPKFRFGQKVEPTRYQEIQGLVDEQTAIVEWYITSRNIQAFIVTHQGEQPISVATDIATDSNAVEALANLTMEYLVDYLKDDNRYEWRPQLPSYLQRLAEILQINRLLSQIPDYCQQLILVPYRFLHLFPLHALPVSPPASRNSASQKKPGEETGEESVYLSDCFPQGIRYAPSSQILQISLFEGTDKPAVETASLFAIQNPTGDLDYTNIEVEAIQTVFNRSKTKVLKAEKANKTAFNQAVAELKETGFAHFSCHGYFNFANPQISGLILAGAELPETAVTESKKPRIRSRRGEFNPDECLTLPEIFNLRLPQCRLVALSACETGITDISTNTDEYISILAGFFFAGARNVLGTLWAVNDVSTAVFMIRFYETLLGEKQPPVALALKQTQEWMRSSTVADLLDWVNGCVLINQQQRQEMSCHLTGWYELTETPWRSPYYWAGFCAVGQ